jgi:uncharacterized protein
MWFGAPADELALLAAVIVLGGVIAGILAGLFGVGGGSVIVPVLYEVFRILDVPEELRMQLSVGTSLTIMVPTAIGSYRAHCAKGVAIQNIVRLWAAPAVVGVAVGSVLAVFAPGVVFKFAFVTFACVIAVKLLFVRDSSRPANELARSVGAWYGFVVGLCSALTGVSGGSISNLILTLHGKSIHEAVATSAGLGVPVSIAGSMGYMLAGLPHQTLLPPLSIGFVSVLGVVVMAPVSSFTAGYGARLAHALSKRRLEVAFGLFLLAVSARFLTSLI